MKQYIEQHMVQYMKQYIIAIFITLSSIHTTLGQSDAMNSKSVTAIDFYSKNKIGVSFSSFANDFGGIQCNFAKGIHQNWDINTEIGYIYTGPDKITTSGYRLRIQPRYNVVSNETISGFVSAGYQIRKTTSDVENIFSRYNNSYYQQMIHQEKRTLQGIFVMVGMIGKLTENLYLTGAIGVGPGKLDIAFNGVPADAQEVYELGDITSSIFGNEKREGSYNSMLFIANFNISYKW
jgi:hypothetical protein